MVKLNIGAGKNLLPPQDGWINIDAVQWDGRIDLVIDLEKKDLPYDNNSIDEIYMTDFLEHLCKNRQIPFLEECFRVMRMGAKIFIQVPDMGTAAQRYCGVLENPTELQHNVNGFKLAEMTYGGQEYETNFHKWGYDKKSLTERLEQIGFSVWSIRSDGGMNIHCNGAKPFTKVILPVGGGLGDIFQIYLASPSSTKAYEEDSVDPNEFPTSNMRISMWLKRLKSLKKVYPDIYIKAVIKSSTGDSRILFDENPYIDEVEVYGDFRDKLPDGYWYNYAEDGYRCITRAEYMVENFIPDPVEFYTEPERQEIIDKILIDADPYIVMQQSAGIPLREPISIEQYLEIAECIIAELNYNVVILGFSDKRKMGVLPKGVIDFTNISTPSASMQIAINADGFIGTHSCYVLCAWYARIPSVCIVPPYHDGGQLWEEFFALKDNPTVWGAHKPFNKTIIVNEANDFRPEQAIKAIVEAGIGKNTV